jgi:hypothetical protein
MTDFRTFIQRYPDGPYGTNEGDIWAMTGSTVGDRLESEHNLLGVHEVLRDPKTGKLDERIYTVELDNPDPDIQDIIKRARAGVAKHIAAQAERN